MDTDRGPARPAGPARPGVQPPPVGAARVYAGYLALQAAAGFVLWVLISSSGFVRSGFELVVARPAVTDSFFVPDMVVVATSGLGAWAIWTARPWAVAAVAFTAGGVVYPTAYLFAWVASTDGTGSVALLVMIVVSTLTLWTAAGVYRLDRDARSERHPS